MIKIKEFLIIVIISCLIPIIIQILLGKILDYLIIWCYQSICWIIIIISYRIGIYRYDIYLKKNYPIKYQNKVKKKEDVFIWGKTGWFKIFFESSSELQDEYDQNISVKDLTPYIKRIKTLRKTAFLYIPFIIIYPFINYIIMEVILSSISSG